MPTTHKATLADFIPGVRNSQTRNNRHATWHHQSRAFSVSATGTFALAAFSEEVLVHKVRFIPDATIASNGSNYWQVQLTNAGTNGLGNTQIGTTFSGATTGLTSLVEADLFAQTSSNTAADCVAQTVLSITFTKNGTPATLAGQVVVDYSPVVA